MNILYKTKLRIQNNKGMLILINKSNPLPKDYRPYDMCKPCVAFACNDNFEKTLLRKEAAHSLEALFNCALKYNIQLYGISFFRPYFRQDSIYKNTVLEKGEAYARLHVAKPGYSEHQSGLSADISSRGVGLQLTESFGQIDDGIWLFNNAHKFGFIIRYPKDKEHITGYAYEPWHIRYVGKYIATNIFNNNLTLEEWYELNSKFLS